ncbi:MAG TPA: chorismate synthase [Ruminococcaceae bacterium]|nr:chorismate synthase [Oscillospiraceae bacterium]
MSYSIGDNIRIDIFGESHADEIGVKIDGFPKGFSIDFDELRAFMLRRAAVGAISTARKEKDEVHFTTGVENGVTTGETITAVIRNSDARPQAYADLAFLPRPGHADYTAYCKYGEIKSGGGAFSGRMTAPLCIAGALCKQWLESLGVTVGAHIQAIHGISDTAFDPTQINAEQLRVIQKKEFPVADEAIGEAMKKEILIAKANGDSVGGIIECAVVGLPCGLGGPLFDGLEGKISACVFGIPAVKGVEFGNGFACAALTGSENNDAFYYDGDTVKTKTNRCGGILGGISTAMPLVIRVAMKPTPSIAKEQDTVSLTTKENKKICVGGRHDPCIVHRAVPCVEAAVAVALADIRKGRTEHE